MKNYNQQIIKFDYHQNFKDDDFYVSISNEHIFDLLNEWPKWEKNFLNISGERYSGKTHLVNIFLNKFKGVRLDFKSLSDESLKNIKVHQNIILEDIDKNLNERLLYALFNVIDQDSKFLIMTSINPISEIKFRLEDLRSRTKNCLLAKIEKPDDELMFALILKNLSDRQIIMDKKLINFIIKRIDRSYGKIFEFIYKIDMISLKKKKSIDFKIINEALENQSE